MSSSYIIHVVVCSLLILLFISSFQLCYCIGNQTIFCPEIEEQSLLTFKQSVEDPKNLLSSWSTEVNCCKWKGVICNSLSGHVHQLRLRSNIPWYDFERTLRGKINPSLLNLKYLRYLDLSGNNFSGEIPSFIGLFENLEYLNLSFTGYKGKVPHNIGNLSYLHTLDLSYLSFVVVDSVEWLSGLSQLEYLNMDSADLSKANNWAQVINSLPSLVELHFEVCSLDFVSSLDNVNISTSLKHLYLSYNYPSFTTIPIWFFQFPNLLSLDLAQIYFTGPVPTVTNSTKLQHIDLWDNHLNSSIPDWFYLCKDLKYVDLSLNNLNGTISNSIVNLTSLNTLNVNSNRLYDDFKNSLSGEIPFNIGKLSSLENLLLYGNKFTGTLPESLGQLSKLQQLDIENNMFQGVVTETHFANLTKLERFWASGNQLTLKVSRNWIPPFQLSTLQLGSWKLGTGSHILSWLKKQRNVVDLDLSNTGIRGSLPRISDIMSSLDLPHNSFFYCMLDRTPPHNSFFDCMLNLNLSNNSFSGGISHFLCDTAYQTYRLGYLNLRGNQLSGEIPDCWMKWPSLGFLNLGNNNLSGRIPNSIGHLTYLLSLNLHGNRLSGNIPFVLQNCTQLVMMDLGDNNLDGGIPTWVGTQLFQLTFLILRSNKLSGEIPPEICHLTTLQVFDLSGNEFSGVIPRCLSNFTAMATERSLYIHIHNDSFSGSITLEESASVILKGSELEYKSTLPLVTNINLSKNKLSGNIPEGLTILVELRSLNLSENHLTGSIPDSIGDMKQLESLDLSINSLSGQIPNSFKLLSFLDYLNLSNNNLTGRIPESTQLRGFDASRFTGNSLCGPPLQIKCNDDGNGNGDDKEKKEEAAEEAKVEWFYVVVSLGYAVGLSGVCSALLLNKSWREAYFGLLEMIWDKLYVYVHIKWSKLSKS